MRFLAASVAGCVLAFGAAAADAPDPHAALRDVSSDLHAGHADAAERDATTALSSDALSPLERAHTLLNRALARETLGKQQDALADFNNAIWLNVLPANEKSRALFDRGVTLDELGHTADAIADYTAALSIAPNYAAALNDRANAERRLGKIAEAKADYEASLAAGNAEKKYPLFGLGEIAVLEGDTQSAATDFRAALSEDASYTVAAQRLAALQSVPQPAKIHEPEKAPTKPQLAAAPRLRGIEDRSGSHETKLASLDTPHIPSLSGGATLQLGAFRGEDEAQAGWKTLLSKAGNTLDGIAPVIVAADIPGKGRFWRLRVGPLDKARAASICDVLRAKGAACIPVRD